MPLSFNSASHGPVAFGFFNIASDMLLLEQFFFFCDDFCDWVTTLAEKPSPCFLDCGVFHIKTAQDTGDLMGAIHGIRFTGFIGRVYEQFPFPQDPALFKQDPTGHRTRQKMQKMIALFAAKKSVQVGCDNTHFRFGPYVFTQAVFHELIRYVRQGGYPRWEKGIRPACVNTMAARLQKTGNRFFAGVFP
ncbi:MAG: hypothetical protein K9K40_06940 [Desulfotignum sp.]|nr:hypothetical protein [Desulfotignum sp.]MCF8126404.1 hypothetical protein [Desulfotignum sp.]